MARVGVLGGSGLYKMSGVSDVREVKVKTPFGDPSDSYFIGKLDGHEVVFLPRHGIGHKYNPSEVNYRANIFGFKILGCEWVIAVSAVGSLQEEIKTGDIVIIDQFIDKTKFRKDTFYENGCAAHIPFSEPTCPTLRSYLLEGCKAVAAKENVEVRVHPTGTYVNMEGPAFSTYAESCLHRSWGAQVIGMTAVAEAKLAREAEISYAVLAMATDYDCWKTDEDPVTVEAVIATMQANVIKAQNVVKATVPLIGRHTGPHPQEKAMENAIMSAKIPPATARKLAPLIRKYVKIPEVENPAVGLVMWATATWGLTMLLQKVL